MHGARQLLGRPGPLLTFSVFQTDRADIGLDLVRLVWRLDQQGRPVGDRDRIVGVGRLCRTGRGRFAAGDDTAAAGAGAAGAAGVVSATVGVADGAPSARWVLLTFASAVVCWMRLERRELIRPVAQLPGRDRDEGHQDNDNADDDPQSMVLRRVLQIRLRRCRTRGRGNARAGGSTRLARRRRLLRRCRRQRAWRLACRSQPGRRDAILRAAGGWRGRLAPQNRSAIRPTRRG